MPELNRITPHILTATDFSDESRRAFYHALSLAVGQQARMTLLHIGPESRKEIPWDKYPGVRDTLAKWQLLEDNAPRNAVSAKLGLGIKKMAMRDEDAYNGLVDYLRKHPTDLLVMSTEARRGWARMKRSSVAQAVAYTTRSRALLLPRGSSDLIDRADGKRQLHKALFVYDHEPDPRPALTWLNSWLPVFGDQVNIHLLYIGDEEDAPEIALPNHPGLKWTCEARDGKPLSVILDYAAEMDTQLIIMQNQRNRGILSRLRGTLCEQVVRRAKRPILLMPEL